MNPTVYLLQGEQFNNSNSSKTTSYTKALTCLLWCIMVTFGVAYVVGATNRDYNNNCDIYLAVFSAIDLGWSICALCWFTANFTRVKREEAFRNILLCWFIPLYAFGMNITAYHCHQTEMDLLYAWSVGWHALMSAILLIACVYTLISCCKTLPVPASQVTFHEQGQSV